jgi:hypothetical protein
VTDLRTSDAARRRMRAYLQARDGRGCKRCGDPIDRGETASIGHVIARAYGGSDAAHNLRLEHLTCNLRAGADRDHIVREKSNTKSASIAVFHPERNCAAPPTAVSNGAGSGANRASVTRYRLMPPRGPRIDQDGR